MLAAIDLPTCFDTKEAFNARNPKDPSPLQVIPCAVLGILSEDSISRNPAASRHAGTTQMWNEM